jgi:diguanylate cyclase (GGDEF)-like protein
LVVGARNGRSTPHQAGPELGSLPPARPDDHDPLTGLHNRHRFDRELDAHLHQATERGFEPSALLLIDVDGFRFVNDSRGHRAGDQLLREIGARLRSVARATDLLARIGGDEFALLLRDTHRDDALAVAQRLIEAVRDDSRVGTGVSIGIAVFDGTAEGVDGHELLIAADIALFEAKEAGRGQAVVSTGKRGQSLAWIEEIRAALDQGRLIVYVQPIIDLRTERTVRDELLLRMLDSDDNVIPPGSFLPTAERFGLIEDIDRFVLSQAVALAGRARPMAINLSGRSLSSAGLLADIMGAIDGGLDPSWLNFEITETAAVTNMVEAQAFATSLSAMGCSVGLDDFGTGFSSFTYLKYLPVDYLKIDVQFVRDLSTSSFDQTLVKAIVDIARALEIKTVAEGVEDAEALSIVQEMGVDYAQGFYLSRPYRMPSAQADSRRA